MKKLRNIGLSIGLATLLYSPLATAGNESFIPEEKILRQIEQFKYDDETMSCSDYAVLYHNILQARGYKTKVVAGYIHRISKENAYDRVATLQKKTHTRVLVLNPKDNLWYLIDPTWDGTFYDNEGKVNNEWNYPNWEPMFEFEGKVTKKMISNAWRKVR